jgi:hypothetical protein
MTRRRLPTELNATHRTKEPVREENGGDNAMGKLAAAGDFSSFQSPQFCERAESSALEVENQHRPALNLRQPRWKNDHS